MKSKLEDIVPPLELCQELAEKYPEAFQDSALVWVREATCKYSLISRELITPWVHEHKVPCGKFVPAPTLAEILKELPGQTHLIKVDDACEVVYYDVYNLDFSNVGPCDPDSTVAALSLWMRLKKEGK